VSCVWLYLHLNQDLEFYTEKIEGWFRFCPTHHFHFGCKRQK